MRMERRPYCSFHRQVETRNGLNNVVLADKYQERFLGGDMSTPRLRSRFDIQPDISEERRLPSPVKGSAAVLSAGGHEP